MIRFKSPSPFPRRVFARLSQRARRIILISPLLIVLAITLAFGLAGRTATAQKDIDARAETALKGKADFLLRETYRVASEHKRQRASASDAQRALPADDEIRGLSKIIDVHSQDTESVLASVVVRLASPDTTELRTAGFAIESTIDNIATIKTDANRFAWISFVSLSREDLGCSLST